MLTAAAKAVPEHRGPGRTPLALGDADLPQPACQGDRTSRTFRWVSNVIAINICPTKLSHYDTVALNGVASVADALSKPLTSKYGTIVLLALPATTRPAARQLLGATLLTPPLDEPHIYGPNFRATEWLP